MANEHANTILHFFGTPVEHMIHAQLHDTASRGPVLTQRELSVHCITSARVLFYKLGCKQFHFTRSAYIMAESGKGRWADLRCLQLVQG